MKINILGLLIAGILATPLTAIANSDDSQYPATNFQPKVIFADESAKSNGSSRQTQTSTFDAEYPAANFQPKILYVDASASNSGSSSSRPNSTKGETSAYDPKYPAANFEPRVIYP